MADTTVSVRANGGKSGAPVSMESFQHLIQHIKQTDPMLYEALKKTYEQVRSNTQSVGNLTTIATVTPSGPTTDVTVTNFKLGGQLTSHNTAALFSGTIVFPVGQANYSDLRLVEVQFVFPDGQGIVVARYDKPPDGTSTTDFSFWDDRVLLQENNSVVGCLLRFYTVSLDYTLGPNPAIIPVTLPALTISAVVGSEHTTDRWQTLDTRQVHSVVNVTVQGVSNIPFYVTIWTNHPATSPDGLRRWHGWFEVQGSSTIPIGANGSNTELYSPLVDETWTVTVEVGTTYSNMDPTGYAVTGPIVGDGAGGVVVGIQTPAAGLITAIVVPPPGSDPFPYDLIPDGDMVHRWSLDYIQVDTTAAYDAVNVFTVILTAEDLGVGGISIGPEHVYGTPLPIKSVLNFGNLIGPYGTEAVPPRTGSIESVRLRAYLANTTNQTTAAWQDPKAATLQVTKDVIVAVGGVIPPTASLAAPPDVTASGVTVGGRITSHNTGALFTGTINYPTTAPNYNDLNLAEVEFAFPSGERIIVARYEKPVSPATTVNFTIWDDRILLGTTAVSGCSLRFFTSSIGGGLGTAPFDVPITLPAYGITSVSGTESNSTRWQDLDRQVHSIVQISVTPINSVPFFATFWTNHPSGSPNGTQKWHGWYEVNGSTTIPIGVQGSGTNLYSPVVGDETWTTTVDVGIIYSNQVPDAAAITGPITGSGTGGVVSKVLLPATGLITAITVTAPGPNPFPYDLLPDGAVAHVWSIPDIQVDTTAAYNAVNVFSVILTVQELGVGGTPVSVEHIYGTPLPVQGILHFGDLTEPYGTQATPPRTGSIEAIRLRVYLGNTTNLTTSAWQDPQAATLQVTLDVIVAVGGAIPAIATPPAGPPVAPGDVTIGTVTVRYQEGQALVAIAYTAPSPPNDFDRIHAYLYAPDSVLAQPATIGDGGFVIPSDATQASLAGFLPPRVGSRGGPIDEGSYNYDPNNLIVQFEHPAPPVGTTEHWRAILVSGSPSVAEKLISASPFVLFDVSQISSLGTNGAEYAPNYVSGSGTWYEDQAVIHQMLPTMWFTLTWTLPTNDPRWDRVVSWELYVTDPTKSGAVPGHVASVARDATSYALDSRWNLTYDPVQLTLWLVPQDANGNRNTFVKGINDIANFTVKTTRGLQLQYADGSTIDGIDFEVDPATNTFKIKNLDLTKVYGPSYTSEFQVVGGKFQWGTNLDFTKFDPTSMGGPFHLDTTNGIFNFLYDPASFAVQPNGQFVITNLPATLFNTEFSVDANGDIQIAGVDFTKALPGTFTTEFSKGAGNIFQVNALAADKIKTGVLEVGGADSGGNRVSRFKVFDTTTPTANLIGWIGDDTAGSGYVGAWFKRVLIGGTSPATAKIVADANGNVAVPAGVITAGTLVAGVIYAGNISAVQINAGYLNVGGPSQAGQIFVNNAAGANIGWIGTYLYSGTTYEGAWFKRILLGGTDPSVAKIACDINGNLTITGGTLSAPNILSASISTATISGGNISGATLVLNANGVTTSVQNQGGNAPVTSTYIGLKCQDNTSSNWTGLSTAGVGTFTPSSGYSILFSDALQVYQSTGTVLVRLGPSSSGATDPGLYLKGIKVVREQYTAGLSDLTSVIACLRYHGLST